MAICIKLRHLLTCRREYKAVHGPCGIPSDPPGVNKSTPVTYGQLELPLAGNPSKHKEFDSTALYRPGFLRDPLDLTWGSPHIRREKCHFTMIFISKLLILDGSLRNARRIC